MRRSFDELHAPARRQIFRSYVGPFLTVVASDIERTIVRSCPDHAFLERRLSDRIKRAVKLFARNVARDRFTTAALTTFRTRREIRRDLFPRHSFITRAMDVL